MDVQRTLARTLTAAALMAGSLAATAATSAEAGRRPVHLRIHAVLASPCDHGIAVDAGLELQQGLDHAYGGVLTYRLKGLNGPAKGKTFIRKARMNDSGVQLQVLVIQPLPVGSYGLWASFPGNQVLAPARVAHGVRLGRCGR
jgi:hypothetical protein